MTFVELHFHLLPGIDDGPRTLDESIALAIAATDEGTGTVVTTPHIHEAHVTDPLELPQCVAVLGAQLRREGIDLGLRVGGELAHPMVPRLSDRQLEVIAQGPQGRRWLLVEAPFTGLDEEFSLTTDELRQRGFSVLLAHPERAKASRACDRAIEHELANGSLLQLTAWSLAGRYGTTVRNRAEALLRRDPRAALSSDAHGRDRQPALRMGMAALAGLGDEDPGWRVDALPHSLLRVGLPVGGFHDRERRVAPEAWTRSPTSAT